MEEVAAERIAKKKKAKEREKEDQRRRGDFSLCSFCLPICDLWTLEHPFVELSTFRLNFSEKRPPPPVILWEKRRRRRRRRPSSPH